jgi:hypothetical protein
MAGTSSAPPVEPAGRWGAALLDAAVAAQEQRELVTLLTRQRRCAVDHLCDVGVEFISVAVGRGAVCTAVTLACLVRGDNRVGGAGRVGRRAFTSLLL